ncbi:unnamed protein product [Rotaria sordida]|uniref:Uncharacterized protein n=1 Tax=Rotaria sordida TaxID=392033 RepID=A0A815UTI5_9BILA|nr:unnamed protein product [Rotaria sordida]CAF1523421.1 unnamed protein product [Rotaria sordida]
MSSYLLVLIVADFEYLTRNNTGFRGNITTNVCAQLDKKNDLYYALEIATQNVHNFEKQYQINYPLTKLEKTDRWQNLNEQMITDNILLPRNTSLSGIMNAWIDQISYPYVKVIRDYSTNMILISQYQFLFDVKAQPTNSPYNYQWYVPF